MSQNNIRIDDDLKKTIIALSDSGISVEELSNEYNVTVQTIYSWIRQHDTNELDDARLMLSKLFIQMKNENKRLKEDKKVLMKSFKIFLED